MVINLGEGKKWLKSVYLSFCGEGATPSVMWDPRSLTRDQTCAPCSQNLES